MEITSINESLSSVETLALNISPPISAEVFRELQKEFVAEIQITRNEEAILITNFGSQLTEHLFSWLSDHLKNAVDKVDAAQKEAERVKKEALATYARLSGLPIV